MAKTKVRNLVQNGMVFTDILSGLHFFYSFCTFCSKNGNTHRKFVYIYLIA
jgi:hypothetical protein